LQIAEVTGANFLFTGASFIDENNVPFKGIFEVPKKVSYKKLLKQNVISCSSVLIKKNYIEKYKMERDDTHEDFGTWLRILKEEPYAYSINEPLLIYRISSKSKSGNKLKSIKMTYKTYRFVGLFPTTSVYYLIWYIFNGLKKYRKIRK
jgi:teichuronic acid biosynthesis glycosyltransferase TuaG